MFGDSRTISCSQYSSMYSAKKQIYFLNINSQWLWIQTSVISFTKNIKHKNKIIELTSLQWKIVYKLKMLSKINNCP